MDIKEMQNEILSVIDGYNNKHSLEHNKELSFYHLVEEIGELAREIHSDKDNWRKEFDKEKFSEELADVLAQVLVLAKDFDVDIETAYKNKMSKFRKRFEL